MVRITLESLSPVSWGGYNRDADPLLVRIPSIRGSVRKWYRWYLASMECAEPSSQEIWKEDFDTFGGVHGGPKKSKVRLWYGSIQVLEKMQMSHRDPFLWALRKRRRTFYRIRFDLKVEAKECKYLSRALKALTLNLILGGFGFRSNRGYWSFKVLSFQEDADVCEEALEALELARDASNSRNVAEWLQKVSKLFKYLHISPCTRPKLWNIQNLSNCYIITIGGYSGWRDALRDTEIRLKNIERSLRFGGRNRFDYRVLLGSPVLDPFRRRKFVWRNRRSSPLILGVGGLDGEFVRGILLLSRDYPDEGPRGVITHFSGGKGLEMAFDLVRDRISREGFDTYWVGDLL